MVYLDNLCAVSALCTIEEGINVECIVNFNEYIHHHGKSNDFCIWESSRFIKVNRGENFSEIQNKYISSNGERLQLSLLAKSVPVNIIKISLSNSWLQSQGIDDILQQNKLFLSPNKLLSIFSEFLDDSSRSIFEKYEVCKIVRSTAFVSSIKRYIEAYSNELKKIRSPRADSCIIDFVIKNFVHEFDSSQLRMGANQIDASEYLVALQ